MEMPWDRRLRIMAEQEQAAVKAQQEREAAATAQSLWTQYLGTLQSSNPAPQPFPMPTCPVVTWRRKPYTGSHWDDAMTWALQAAERPVKISREISLEALDRLLAAQKEMNGGRYATASPMEKIRFNAYVDAARKLFGDPTKPGAMNVRSATFPNGET